MWQNLKHIASFWYQFKRTASTSEIKKLGIPGKISRQLKTDILCAIFLPLNTIYYINVNTFLYFFIDVKF